MTTADIQSRLTYWAGVYGVPPSIALSLAQQESGFNQAARGSSGEVGVLQILPTTAAGLRIDPYDPEANIEGGMRLLSQNYARFGSWDYALAGYNCGGACAARGAAAWPASTQTYVPAILARAGASATDSWDVPGVEDFPMPIDEAAMSTGGVSGWALLAVGAIALLLLTD